LIIFVFLIFSGFFRQAFLLSKTHCLALTAGKSSLLNILAPSTFILQPLTFAFNAFTACILKL